MRIADIITENPIIKLIGKIAKPKKVDVTPTDTPLARSFFTTDKQYQSYLKGQPSDASDLYKVADTSTSTGYAGAKLRTTADELGMNYAELKNSLGRRHIRIKDFVKLPRHEQMTLAVPKRTLKVVADDLEVDHTQLRDFLSNRKIKNRVFANLNTSEQTTLLNQLKFGRTRGRPGKKK
jgi:hypothetical protein